MNIMIVEDDHILAKDLLSLPRRRGIKRRSAADNGAGSRLCGTADIALVDLACRRTDGASLGRKLIDRFRLEVIYVTEAGRFESRPGSSEVIMKPLSEEQDSAAIARAALRHATRYDRIR